MGEMMLKGAWLYDWPEDSSQYATAYWDGTSDCMYALGNSTWVTFPMWLRFISSHNPIGWQRIQGTFLAANHTADDL